MKINARLIFVIVALIGMLFSENSVAQENYEIQVYASPTVSKDTTMVELHSNFTFDGEKNIVKDVLPTNHILHETIEITHGFTDWMELGFYIFTAIGDNNRTSYVGSHIRPRVMAPAKWNWPVGVSISAEAGYQKLQYSEDDWTLELRPIIDKKFNKLYLALNPTFDKSLRGINQKTGFIFSPNIKISYAVTSKISPGIEYYGSIGPLNFISPYQQQQHQIFLTADINFSAKWEFNMGYGFGFTESTDRSIFKIILGRKFGK